MNPRHLGLGALALLAAAALGTAQIERLTLDQMVAKTDNAVLGEITKKEVIRIDHPIDGPELYFTHLTVKGRSLVDGKELTAVVTYPGGFVNDTDGVWNSEAPSDEDTKLGNEVVVFYKHSENMGGDLEADALYASHGGLFRTATGRQGKVVLGRGEGYAISDNVLLSTLDENVTELKNAQK
ncbi:MAG: hypothetical protein H6828_16595 [Planctomycetes bacterium]|nr:hypothetical protein [Planctomycetota bacterium]